MKLKGPDGQLHEVETISVENASERWNEYLLNDGTVLRAKLVLTEVHHFIGMYNDKGDPLYAFNSTTVYASSSPDRIRRPE